ncbi:N-acetyllactosaminide 3-alpha-galactosyltransferase [Teladorsagia circumcincta]|uniref:Hexosyltransferase n=1 Tax=Teladorsagia circumcincta TaxID=45464 RepID=A0A2G9UBN4_TELCI|nr:N-acetyllactosaminide 3-alpha-galactosyltransferase [Teladorsagia circumcincta]
MKFTLRISKIKVIRTICVFIIGTGILTLILNELPIKNKNKTVSVLFVTGTHRVTAPFIDELRKYNDVLQVHLPDTYPSLVYKAIAHLEKPNEKFILCYVLQNVKPEREVNNPWYIPESAYSEHYLPDYCNGPTYLMTPAALAALMEAAEKAKVFEVEDAFFTGVLASLAGVRRMKLRGIWNRVILAAYRWIAANYPDKFVLKVDHDVVLLLDKVIAHLGKPNEKCILCYVLQNVKPEREANNPWYIPESAYSEQYLPDYCNGPTYLMTPAALAALMKAAEKAKVFEVEDAFFTGVLASLAGIQRMKLRGIWNRVPAGCLYRNTGPRDACSDGYVAGFTRRIH